MLAKPSLYFSRSLAIEATPAEPLRGSHSPLFYPIAAHIDVTKTPILVIYIQLQLVQSLTAHKILITSCTCLLATNDLPAETLSHD